MATYLSKSSNISQAHSYPAKNTVFVSCSPSKWLIFPLPNINLPFVHFLLNICLGLWKKALCFLQLLFFVWQISEGQCTLPLCIRKLAMCVTFPVDVNNFTHGGRAFRDRTDVWWQWQRAIATASSFLSLCAKLISLIPLYSECKSKCKTVKGSLRKSLLF